jgi:aspartyl aminopeptidase
MDVNFRNAAKALLDFIDASPSPFHAVRQAVSRLQEAGFAPLDEEEAWNCEPHGRYYVTRNDSTLAAFIPGGAPVKEAGFRIIGAHTDSPSLRVKPVPSLERQGYLQLAVEVYGGPILASWLDRDLGLAGRVIVEEPRRGENGAAPRLKSRLREGARRRTGPGRARHRQARGTGAAEAAAADPGVVSRLLAVRRPVARVSGIAIHLDREVNEKGLLLNRELHLPPILGLIPEGEDQNRFESWLGEELGIDPERILDHDLFLYDLAPACFAGIGEEFLSAPRLDNLASSHAALSALLGATGAKAAETRIIVLYDNEEIGSATKQGAAGTFLHEICQRLGSSAAHGATQDLYRARARSWLLSADMAHAVHPNYSDRHDPKHMPRLNGGPVIKFHAAQRYATDGETSAFFQRLCREAGVPFQKFAMRADMACGSTIGPIVSTRLGLRTVDIGSPMLAMHSIREFSGSMDPLYMVRAMGRFLGA